MTRVSISGAVRGPSGLLAKRESFESYGAMTAVPFGGMSTGRMPAEWAKRYRDDTYGVGVVYTVISYATPIAWVRSDGETVIPDESYSVTSSRHQNLCRAWLG
jgi:hypothetical protein